VTFCVRTAYSFLEIHSRGCKEGCDHFEDICVAPRGIVESGCIDQNDTTTVQIEITRELYGVRARPQPSANAEVGSADEIGELCDSWSDQGRRIVSFLANPPPIRKKRL